MAIGWDCCQNGRFIFHGKVGSMAWPEGYASQAVGQAELGPFDRDSYTGFSFIGNKAFDLWSNTETGVVRRRSFSCLRLRFDLGLDDLGFCSLGLGGLGLDSLGFDGFGFGDFGFLDLGFDGLWFAGLGLGGFGFDGLGVWFGLWLLIRGRRESWTDYQ